MSVAVPTDNTSLSVEVKTNTSEAAPLRGVTCAPYAALCVVRRLVKQTDVPSLQQYIADGVADLLTYKKKKEERKSNRNVVPSKSHSIWWVCNTSVSERTS
jgi:hypothetical protein